jgi:hypothetical protein
MFRQAVRFPAVPVFRNGAERLRRLKRPEAVIGSGYRHDENRGDLYYRPVAVCDPISYPIRLSSASAIER